MRSLAFLTLLAASATAGPLTIKGSDTMVVLAQRWAEEFMKTQPQVKIQVTGGGSGTGISALINGTTELAISSRSIKEAEQKLLKARQKTTGHALTVARDGVTFFINEQNPLTSLTAEQLEKIYLGDVTNWKEVGGPDAPLVLYSRENSSGTYVFVKDHLLHGEDFAPTAQTLPGTAAVVNAVAREKWGIGFGGAAYAKGVRALKIRVGGEEIAPNEANVKSGKYPLSRALYFYLRAPPAGDTKAFIDFCLSDAGQQVVTRVGFFPVK